MVGCNSNDSKSDGTANISSDVKHKHCVRGGDAGEGVNVNLSYDVYYKGEDILLIKSVEEIETTNQETLDTYENSYRSIHEKYKDLKYYDTKIIRTDSKVTSQMDINYDKIDINQLINIEGSKDNIIENGRAKLDKWLDLAEKFGTKCEDVED